MKFGVFLECVYSIQYLGVEGDSVDIVSTIGLTADWAGCIGFVFGEPVGRTVMAQNVRAFQL